MKNHYKKMKALAIAAAAFLFLGSSANAQTATIVGPTLNCQGTPLTLTVNITGLNGPYSYQWTNGATTSTVTVSATTVIRVTVTGTNNNGATVSVNSPFRLFLFLPSPSVNISANGPTNLCASPTVNLTANGSGGFITGYAWNTGATTQSISVSTPGTYTVVVTSAFGCTASASQAVTASSAIQPKVNPLGPLTFCKPGSVMLEADPGASAYLWSTGETTQTITVTLTGSGGGPILDTMAVYYLIEPGTVCETKSDVVVCRSIREPKLESPFCPNFNMALSDSIKSEIVLKYNGVKPDYEFEFTETTNPGPTITETVSGTRWLRLNATTPPLKVGKFYNVRTRAVINGVGYCYGNFCQIGITSMAPPAGYVLRTVYDSEGEAMTVRDGLNFGIYPNPSSDVFTAKLFTIDENVIETTVYDMTGRAVARYAIDPTANEYAFGAELIPGMYMVEFKQGQSLRQTAKIIKTN